MRRLRITFACLLCLFLISGMTAVAQVSATGHITAEVITALSAVETSQMSFGRFSRDRREASLSSVLRALSPFWEVYIPEAEPTMLPVSM